jgi:hypothetical protein
VVVLVETSTCRNRGSACGLEGAREKRREQGSSRGSRTSMKTCGSSVRRPAGGTAPRESPKGSPCRPRTIEGTSLLSLGLRLAQASGTPNPDLEQTGRIDVQLVDARSPGWRSVCSRGPLPCQSRRGVRGFDSTGAPSAEKAWAPPLPRDSAVSPASLSEAGSRRTRSQ